MVTMAEVEQRNLDPEALRFPRCWFHEGLQPYIVRRLMSSTSLALLNERLVLEYEE